MDKHCAFLTMEDLTGFYAYDSMTFAPLKDLGWTVDEVPWNRPLVNWSQYDAVVIRSTWDYQKQPELFLKTLEEIETAGTALFNPLEICRWNMDKHYLRDLQRKGVSIIPTIWQPSMKLADFDRWQRDLNSDRLVVKPTIGANADDTFVLSPDKPEELDQAARIFNAKPLMIQPFVSSIQTRGEYSLFYFGGEYSHAINKLPKTGDFRVQEEHGGQISSIEPSAQLKAQGQRVLDQLGETLLYARIDFVIWQDYPALIEVELIEPSLYFAYSADSSQRFADALNKMMIPPQFPDRSLPRRALG
jgi:hypothetical protein